MSQLNSGDLCVIKHWDKTWQPVNIYSWMLSAISDINLFEECIHKGGDLVTGEINCHQYNY